MTHLGYTYGLVNSNNEIVEYRNDVDPDLPVKSGFKWLLIVESSFPTYNIQTQNITGPFYTVNENDITKYWNVIDKTPEEIDGEKVSKILSVGPNILNILLHYENKTRQTPLTLEEYVVYLKDYF